MIDTSALPRLANFEQHAIKIRDHFKLLAQVPSQMRPNVQYHFKTLTAEDVESYIEMKFQGIELRFTLFMTYGETKKPIGEVVCSHRYTLLNEPSTEILGRFEWGDELYMTAAAEPLIISFLDLAVQSKRLGVVSSGL